MKRPIFDFITEYNKSGTLRCHMPGHKGRAVPRELAEITQLDITEISGADSLFEASGIIAESEKIMSELYRTTATVYSATGSTLCIQAMLAVMKQENRRIFAVRNVHRAFLNAAALLGIGVEWIIPVYNGGILSGEIVPEQVEELLKSCSEPSCLYVTSPDYTGKTADIAALAEICRRYDSRLIVDNAHGAHLAFMPENLHPIALGADLCCDSAHKMLPALTGAAMLHSSREEYSAARLKQTMGLFASTSPSYPIMASLDLCTEYIRENIRADIAENLTLLRELRTEFSGTLKFAEGEPFHVTIMAEESGFCGTELAQLLRENDCECEYADDSLVILLMSPVCRWEDYIRLKGAMWKALEKAERHEPKSVIFELYPAERAMSVRDAVFAPCEEISVDEALGRICGAVNVPCPPAVPIAVSGEIISENCINILKRYGISTVNVVK